MSKETSSVNKDPAIDPVLTEGLGPPSAGSLDVSAEDRAREIFHTVPTDPRTLLLDEFRVRAHIADAIRSAESARDARWREALDLQENGRLCAASMCTLLWEAAHPKDPYRHECLDCAPLRALLSGSAATAPLAAPPEFSPVAKPDSVSEALTGREGLEAAAQSLLDEMDALERTGANCVPSLGVLGRIRAAIASEQPRAAPVKDPSDSAPLEGLKDLGADLEDVRWRDPALYEAILGEDAAEEAALTGPGPQAPSASAAPATPREAPERQHTAECTTQLMEEVDAANQRGRQRNAARPWCRCPPAVPAAQMGAAAPREICRDPSCQPNTVHGTHPPLGTTLPELNFALLREANRKRQQEWDPSDAITLEYRGNELAGEVGEACNVVKKLARERLGIRGSRASNDQLADELADVIICADLIALHAGLDLGRAVSRKFNATSEKNGLSVFLRRRESTDFVEHRERAAPAAPPAVPALPSGARQPWVADSPDEMEAMAGCPQGVVMRAASAASPHPPCAPCACGKMTIPNPTSGVVGFDSVVHRHDACVYAGNPDAQPVSAEELAAAEKHAWTEWFPGGDCDHPNLTDSICLLCAADGARAAYARGRKDAEFGPLGDNHHNAAACPYCGDLLSKAEARGLERAAQHFDSRANALRASKRYLVEFDVRRMAHEAESAAAQIRALSGSAATEPKAPPSASGALAGSEELTTQETNPGAANQARSDSEER